MSAPDEYGDAPYVCPGCHAVAGPCLPGCPDAAIEARFEAEYLADDPDDEGPDSEEAEDPWWP